jgi:hypothetical protein
LRKVNGRSGDGKSVPQNSEFERYILGSLLLDESRLDAIAAILHSENFFVESHRRIFSCMLMMRDSHLPIDVITVTDALHSTGELAAIGDSAKMGAAYISSLPDGMPRQINLEYYAKRIKELANSRMIMHTAHNAIQLAADSQFQEAKQAIESLHEFLRDDAPRVEIFDTLEEFENTPPPTFSIEEFLQDFTVTAIAGLSGDGKTWATLSIIKALLDGPGDGPFSRKLWGLFEVCERADKVIYLIPESTRSPFKQRLQKMDLYKEIGKRLFVRTLSKGPALPLTHASILREAKNAYLVTDTAIRFLEKADDHNDAHVAAVLSEDFFKLLHAETRSIMALFHAPKNFRAQKEMNLDMIRGSSEFGAVLATGWGIRQIHQPSNTIYVQNIKDRDFKACGPFQLRGRPAIDDTGDFELLKRDSPFLAELQNTVNTGRAAVKDSRVETVVEWYRENSDISPAEIVSKFIDMGIEVKPDTAYRYRKEAVQIVSSKP